MVWWSMMGGITFFRLVLLYTALICFLTVSHVSLSLCDSKGSITGAYSAHVTEVNPSFILLAVQGDKVVCYVYELINGEVDVSKTEFSKQL